MDFPASALQPSLAGSKQYWKTILVRLLSSVDKGPAL
jgi:hypothetical protein